MHPNFLPCWHIHLQTTSKLFLHFQGYSGRGRPSRAAASRRQQDDDSDEAPAPKPSGRGRGRGGGRGAGRPRGKATAAASRQAAPAGRAAPAKPKHVSPSVMSALSKGINRCEQCGIEFYQQPPFSQASWFVQVFSLLVAPDLPAQRLISVV
jgi:hypothetical protein